MQISVDYPIKGDHVQNYILILEKIGLEISYLIKYM